MHSTRSSTHQRTAVLITGAAMFDLAPTTEHTGPSGFIQEGPHLGKISTISQSDAKTGHSSDADALTAAQNNSGQPTCSNKRKTPPVVAHMDHPRPTHELNKIHAVGPPSWNYDDRESKSKLLSLDALTLFKINQQTKHTVVHNNFQGGENRTNIQSFFEILQSNNNASGSDQIENSFSISFKWRVQKWRVSSN